MIAIFPEIAAAAVRGDVEALALLVRRYFGAADTYAPKPAVAALIAQAGLTVKRLAMPSHGALLAKDERGAFSIVLIASPQVNPLHERFLLAHMLGHYLLDVQPLIARGDWQVSGFQEIVSPLERYETTDFASARSTTEASLELRADQFAAALLLPRGMLRRALAKLQDDDKVAAFFGVTAACLQRRWRDIGRGNNRPSPVDFFDAEQRIGSRSPPLATEHAAPTVLTAPAEASMPRSYAASTYGATEKATRTPAKPSPPASAVTADAVTAAKQPQLGGMERVRELARRLDKGSR